MEWNRPVGSLTDEKSLCDCFQRLCSNDYGGFVRQSVALWKNGTVELRSYIAKRWLPDVYFRTIGLGSVTLLFDIFEFATKKHVDVDVDYGNLLARIVSSILRQKSWPTLQFKPSTAMSDVDDTWSLPRSFSHLWCTPPKLQEKDGKDDKEDKDEKITSVATIVAETYTSEWNKLFSLEKIRQSGLTKEVLFQMAVWYEHLRAHMNRSAFLRCFDAICAIPQSGTIFRDTNLDSNGIYAKTLRLYHKTLRACMIHSIGHRVYSIFYLLVLCRMYDPNHHGPDRYSIHLIEQLTDLDKFTPPVQALVHSILHPTTTTLATAPSVDQKDNKVAVSKVVGMPAGEDLLLLLREKMDWCHSVSDGWIKSISAAVMPEKKDGVLVKDGGTVEQKQLKQHLDSLERLALEEFKRCIARSDLEQVDESTVVPLPNVDWGVDGRASIDHEGRVWCGKYNVENESDQLTIGRTLFRTRKLQEWHLNVCTVTIVLQKDNPKMVWLRHDGLPIEQTMMVEIQRSINATVKQLIIPSRLNLHDLSSVDLSWFTTIPHQANPKHCYGIVQLLALQLARAILGIAETQMRRDTWCYNLTDLAHFTIVPTAMISKRTWQSYWPSPATLRKYADTRAKSKEPTTPTTEATAETAETAAAAAMEPSRSLQTRMKSRKLAKLIVQRAAKTASNATDTGDEKKDGALPEDVLDATAAAILFGKPLTQKTGVAIHLKRCVQKVDFMLEARSRLGHFYDAIKREKEIPHMRTILHHIYNHLPLTLSPDVCYAFMLLPISQ